jgi:hypothetical protein
MHPLSFLRKETEGLGLHSAMIFTVIDNAEGEVQEDLIFLLSISGVTGVAGRGVCSCSANEGTAWLNRLAAEGWIEQPMRRE